MIDLLVELDQVTSAFERAGIDYAVCGGLALTIHGFPRATFDLDLLIRDESLSAAFETAKQLGYDIHGLDISFKERAVEIRRVSKIDEEGEVLSLDLLLVTPQVEDVWRGRMLLEWNKNGVWIVSKAGLIRMKELAGRHKDLIDIDRIKNEED
jgi:hypothetical protein